MQLCILREDLVSRPKGSHFLVVAAEVDESGVITTSATLHTFEDPDMKNDNTTVRRIRDGISNGMTTYLRLTGPSARGTYAAAVPKQAFVQLQVGSKLLDGSSEMHRARAAAVDALLSAPGLNLARALHTGTASCVGSFGAASSTSHEVSPPTMRGCVVCMEAVATVLQDPCAHQVLCEGCYDQI